MKRYIDYYLTSMKVSILSQIQYRVANYFYMIGMITEPVIYLVVWSTIAEQQGGSVGGYTPGTFAAYYIVWTLVRNMNIVFTPFGWEWRIREGMLSMELIRPMHPIHTDIAYFAGWKFVVILLWLPLAAFLTWVFKPTFDISLLEVIVFFTAIWGAFLIRTMIVSLLGMITFWTTRVSAIFELYFGLELILSGRLVPLTLMPQWVQDLSNYLPFKWTFYFPIEALVGSLTPQELWMGVGTQIFWITIGAVFLSFVWRAAIKQFSAVGG
jgi:ABC-2 type transport system permease protein